MIIINENIILEYSNKTINKLINKFQEENPSLPEPAIKQYIENFDKLKNSPKIDNKDLFHYSWNDLKNLVDYYHSDKYLGEIIPPKGEIVYDKNNLLIIKANTNSACIKYSKGYDLCISRKNEDSMYRFYRLKQKFTPYFVIDKDKSTNRKYDGKFEDPNHFLVILVRYSDQKYIAGMKYKNAPKSYGIVNANNVFGTEFYFDDTPDNSIWKQKISKFNPKLKDLFYLFQPEAPHNVENNINQIIEKYDKKIRTITETYQDEKDSLQQEFDDIDDVTFFGYLKLKKIINYPKLTVLVKYSIKNKSDFSQKTIDFVSNIKKMPSPQEYVEKIVRHNSTFFNDKPDLKTYYLNNPQRTITPLNKHTLSYFKEIVDLYEKFIQLKKNAMQ